MSNLTSQQLTLLRSQPHSTKLWLSIYQPKTVLACRVNDADIDRGEREITYNAVSQGSHLLVQSGMTLWVGSSAGKDDLGKVRVRSATSTVLTIAENDHIDWADNLFLTVVSFYEISGVYPRIIQPDPEELEVIFYKDYDIAYTNQNEVLGSFINMGPHHAGFIEGGSAQVYYSASGTVNLKGDALTYAWFFEGATVTGSTSQNPGYISYTTPGHYTTRLTVSNASGGQDVSYRHVSIYDRPENGTNVPFLRWHLDALSGSRAGGGWTGRIILWDTVGENVLKDGSLVVIFADDYYGSTKQSIGGNAENRASIVFVGYVLDGTIEHNYAESSVEFDVGSPTEIMKISEGFSCSVESKTSPDFWFELLNMDIRRAIYHYLRWHTTYLMTNDISFKGTDYPIQFFDADRESLYSAIQTLIRSALVGNAVSDRQGKLWLEVEAYTEGITIPTTFTLHNQDWMEMPEIEQRQHYDLAFLEAGGIAYDGPGTGDFTAHLSHAPGEAPAYRGGLERFQGLALDGQAQLNKLAGDVFAYRNSEFPVNSFLLTGNYRNFDIAPQENILINLAPGDTVRNISFSGKNFLVDSMDWIYDSRIEFFNPRVVFALRTEGFAGDTIPIPDVPDTGGFGNIPPFIFPPIPDFNPSPFLLYDEGVVQGAITEIDFQGSPVVATSVGLYGIVTVEFPGGVTGNDAIGTSRSTSTNMSSATETQLDDGASLYTNGINISSNNFIFTVPGVYMIQFVGNLGNQEIAWQDFLCANKGNSYGGTIKIKHYSAGASLLAEYEEESGRAYCFSGGGGNDVPVFMVGVSISRTLSVEAGQFVAFTFTPDAALTGSPDVAGNISIFRLT